MNYFYILDIVVLIVLALCLLGGLINGFFKSFRKLIALLIPTVLLFIFLTPITNTVMEFKINLGTIDQYIEVIPDEFTTEEYSLVDGIATIFSTYVYPDDPALQQDSQLQTLAISVAEMTIKIVVYFIGLGLVWLTSIILSLILKIFIGRKNGKFKLVGMGMGALRFIVVFLLVFVPMFGMMSLTSTVVHDIAEYQEPEEGSTMKQIVEYADLYEESFTKKYLLNSATQILCTDKNISCDAQFVGAALTIKTENEEVSFVKEYSQIKNAIPSVMKIIEVVNQMKGSEEKVINLSDFTDEDIENISTIARDSKLIRVVIPAALEYAAYAMRNEETDTANLIAKLDNIDWDKELLNLANLVDVLKEHNDLEINVGKLDYILKSEGLIDLVSDIATGAFQLKLVTEVGIPLGIAVLESKLNEPEFAQYEIDIETIKNINWTNEGTDFVTTVLNVYKEYLKVNIDFSDLKVALNDEKLPDFIDYLFDEIDNSTLITDKLLPIVMQVTLAKLEQNQNLDNLDINFDKLKTINWKDNLPEIKAVLHDIVTAYQVLDINPDDFKAVLKNTQLQTQLDVVVTSVLNCEIVADYILPIAMNALCEELSKQDSLLEFGFDFDQIKNTNWKEELIKIKNVANAFFDAYQNLDYDKDNWSLILDNPNLETYVDNIFDESLKSELIKEQILKKLPFKIHSLIDGLDSSMDITFLKHIITEDSILDLFENDTTELINILKEIKALGLFDKQEINLNNSLHQEKIITIIELIFDLSVVKGKEAKIFDSLFKIINLEELTKDYGLTISYLTVTDWDKEVDHLIILFRNVMPLIDEFNNLDFGTLFTNIQTPEVKDNIANVVNAIGSSEIFGDSIYSIIETVVKEIDESYVITLSNEEKDIIEHNNGWYFESMHLLNLIEKIEQIDFSKQYQNLNADEVKDLMLYCSESIISTKVFGTILNSVFEDIEHEDFTNPDVMKNSCDIVYNAITLASMVQDNTLDLNDKTTTDNIINTMESLANSEENIGLVNQFINNIVKNEEPVEYTKEDIVNATEIVESIIEQYQNSTDQDNFDLDNLDSEDLEKIENSDIAKAILESLFK